MEEMDTSPLRPEQLPGPWAWTVGAGKHSLVNPRGQGEAQEVSKRQTTEANLGGVQGRGQGHGQARVGRDALDYLSPAP